MRRACALLAALVLAGCGGDDEDRDGPPPAARDDTAQPPPPPDAGTRAGHGADAPSHVTVPPNDPTPPSATITLEAPGGRRLASASQPPDEEPPSVSQLASPEIRATTLGRDANGGVARVRVSVKERVRCVRAGVRSERLRTRYFPPPQIERIRSRPGARLRTERSRTLLLTLGGGRCGPAEAVAVEAEIWGEAINGSGLEAVTPHIRVEWVR